MATTPYPPGHRRYGDPKTPSVNAAWEMLKESYGVDRPAIKDRIKNGESLEIGDYDQKKKAFPIWVHVIGAAYPEQYWFDMEPPKLDDAGTDNDELDSEIAYPTNC